MKKNNIMKKLIFVICILCTILSTVQNELSMTGGSLKVAEANNKKLVPSNNKYGLKTPVIQDVTRKPLTRKMKDSLLKKTEKWFKKEVQIYCDNYTCGAGVNLLDNSSMTLNVDDADYIKLTWNKVSGATGYQIRLQQWIQGEPLTALNLLDKEHPVTYYPYVKNTTKTSITIKELQSNELIGQNSTIKAWLRPYKTISGKNYYGNWSKVKTINPNKHLPSVELLSVSLGDEFTTISVMPNNIYICREVDIDPTAVMIHVAPMIRNSWCYIQDGYQIEYANVKTFDEKKSKKIVNNHDYKELMKMMEWGGFSYENIVNWRRYPNANSEPLCFEIPSEYTYFRIRAYKVVNGKTIYGVWTTGIVKELKESERWGYAYGIYDSEMIAEWYKNHPEQEKTNEWKLN